MSDIVRTISSGCLPDVDRRGFIKLSVSVVAVTLMADNVQAEGLRRIDDRGALIQALAAGRGGVIILADGDYGEIEITRSFEPRLVLKAENPRRARFQAIRLHQAAAVTLDGVHSSAVSIQQGSTDITVQNSQVIGNLYCRNVSNLNIMNNEVTEGHFGILLNTVKSFTVRHNKIHRVKVLTG
jgi:hypothetical protein